MSLKCCVPVCNSTIIKKGIVYKLFADKNKKPFFQSKSKIIPCGYHIHCCV